MNQDAPIQDVSKQEAPLFTAAQLAEAAGISRQRSYDVMSAITPSSHEMRGGKLVSVWSLADLPESLRTRLSERVTQRGYRSVFHLLADPPKVWHPKCPVADYSPEQLRKADQLRRALLPTLQELNDATITPGDAEGRGLEAYRREFGYGISGRHWHTLLKRTLDRDGGAGDWMRLELYLDERPAPKANLAPPQLDDLFSDLRGVIADGLSNGVADSRLREMVWCQAFELIQEAVETGRDEQETRKAVLDFLERECRFIAKSIKALREQFRVKLARWIAGGGRPSAVQDKRGEKSGNFRAIPLTEDDRNRLIAASLEYGGGLSQAFRELHRKGELSPAVLAWYGHNPLNKSYVPRSIREELTHAIRLSKPIFLGKHAAKMAGAYITRDPTTFNSGDWYQADDLTAPVYYYEEADPFRPIRGQTLVMVDVRSLCVLGFVIIPFPQYTSFDIRNLVTTVYDGYGLPRKGFYFERGIWKQSRLVTGRSNDVEWDETERGLKEYVVFRHAREARGKVIERILGLLQNHMGRVPGYAGRAEMTEPHERLKEHLKLIRAKKHHAGEFLLSKAEWLGRLREIIAAYNSEVQNGEYLPGFSPSQGFEQFFGDIPLTRLPDSCRYLLANHKIPLTVGRNGIAFTLAGRTWRYKGAGTGELVGRQVKAWFNPAAPDILSVTDMENGYLCTAPLDTEIPAMDATKDQIAKAERANGEHNRGISRVFESIPNDMFTANFRRRMFKPCIVDNRTMHLGAKMTEDREAVSAELHEGAKLQRQIQRDARRLNMVPGFTPATQSIEVLRDRAAGASRLLKLFDDAEAGEKDVGANLERAIHE